MHEPHQGWKRMCFKLNKVWVAVDDKDSPRIENDRVLIKYQLDQPHEYRVHPESISLLPEKGGCGPEPSKGKSTPPRTALSESGNRNRVGPHTEEKGTIHVYTDGASSGNPGPSGIGIYLKFGMHAKEISKFIGVATNNIAELEAIRVGLSEIKNPALPVRVYTDSSYALGLLTRGWKPKKNKELVNSIVELIKTFRDIQFVKVQGHAGNEGNEMADGLATGAIKNRSGP